MTGPETARSSPSPAPATTILTWSCSAASVRCSSDFGKIDARTRITRPNPSSCHPGRIIQAFDKFRRRFFFVRRGLWCRAKLFEFILRFLPVFGLLLGRDGGGRVGIEGQDVVAQIRRDLIEIVLG